MKRIFLVLYFLIAVCGVAFAQNLQYGQFYLPKEGSSADELMRIENHTKYSLFASDLHQTGEVLYIEPSGFTLKRIWIRSRIIEGKDNISYKDIIYIMYPTELKGLAVLTWTYEDPKKEQDVWLWIPSLKKVNKISAAESDDAFMGSDLTVQDVSTRKFEDDNYKLIGEKSFDGYKLEQTGQVKYAGQPCFVIEATPARAPWYYSKRIVWLDKETGGIIYEEFFDRNGKLFKTVFHEWAWIPTKDKKYPAQVTLECKDLRTGHRTVVLIKDTKYNTGLPEEDFTTRALSRSRW